VFIAYFWAQEHLKCEMIHLRLPFDEPRRLPFYLAMEEWTTRVLPPDEYFFSWRVRPTVICGRNQEIDKEVDMDYCRQAGIDVVRRKSGGGCVFADMNNFMLSYICPGNEIKSTFARYTTMIANILRNLGLDAKATGRNDIVIGDRKVSGNAFYHLPDRCIIHGTMLYDFNPTVMNRAITPSRAKLESKSVKSVQSRVTCLKEAGIVLNQADFEHYIISELCKHEITLEDKYIEAIEKIEQNYYKPAFLYRKGENTAELLCCDGQKHIHSRIEGIGEIEIRLVLDAEGIISHIEASGDYFLLDDPELMIFSRLKGVPFKPDALDNAIKNIEPEKAIAGLDRATLLHILTEKPL